MRGKMKSNRNSLTSIPSRSKIEIVKTNSIPSRLGTSSVKKPFQNFSSTLLIQASRRSFQMSSRILLRSTF
jgi:hypothetical protein